MTGEGGGLRIVQGQRNTLRSGRVLEGCETVLFGMERIARRLRTSMPGEFGDLTIWEDHDMFRM